MVIKRATRLPCKLRFEDSDAPQNVHCNPYRPNCFRNVALGPGPCKALAKRILRSFRDNLDRLFVGERYALVDTVFVIAGQCRRPFCRWGPWILHTGAARDY